MNHAVRTGSFRPDGSLAVLTCKMLRQGRKRYMQQDNTDGTVRAFNYSCDNNHYNCNSKQIKI
eukprot:1341130-Amphidinium_carterae.1